MPQIGKQFAALEVSQVKVYQLLADNTTGGSLSYGTGITIPVVQEVAFEPGQLVNARWTGDNEVKLIHTVVQSLKGRIVANSLPLDAMAFMFGGTLSQAGSSPNTTTTFNFDGTPMSYFRIEYLVPYVRDLTQEVGTNAKVVLPKCKLVAGPQWTFGNNPTQSGFNFECVRPNDPNSKWWANVSFGESALALD